MSSDSNADLKSRRLIYIVGFLDLLGVSMVLPLIQPYILRLGASSTVAGFVGSIYGFLQLFTSPLVGRWSDVVGHHYSLVFCLTVSATSYLLMGCVGTVILLAFCRVPLGLFKHSQTISRAYISDTVPSESYSTAYGRFNAISNLGFILGAAIGGHLQQRYGFQSASLACGLTFLINAGVVRFVFPSSIHDANVRYLEVEITHKYEDGLTDDVRIKKSSLTYKEQILDAFNLSKWRRLWDLVLTNFLLSLATIVYHSNYASLLSQRYSTTPIFNGYMISLRSAVSMVAGFYAGKVSRWYGDDWVLWSHCIIAQTLALTGMALAPNVILFAFFEQPLCLFTAIMRVVSLTVLIGEDRASTVGAIVGSLQSVFSFSRTMAPVIAGVAQDLTVAGPIIISAALTLITLIFSAVIGRLRIRKKSTLIK